MGVRGAFLKEMCCASIVCLLTTMSSSSKTLAVFTAGGTSTINAPREQVWAVMTDFDKYHEWCAKQPMRHSLANNIKEPLCASFLPELINARRSDIALQT